jgi:hypothetical protein
MCMNTNLAFGVRRSLFGVALLTMLAGPALAASPEEIQGAIERGKAYLYKVEHNGNWEDVQAPDLNDKAPWSHTNEQFGGMTAVATFALLASGESPQDPRLLPAIAFLKKIDSRGTYALGLRCQVWNMIPIDPSVRTAVRRDRDLLMQAMHKTGEGHGFYGYGVNSPPGEYDHSASQFGVLGLWAVNQTGAEIPSNYWSLFEDRWKAQQLPDGSWCYFARVTPGDARSASATPSMTAAGLATLFITQDYTTMSPRCAGNITDPAIEHGLQWLGEHLNQFQVERQYYTMFGISRVGLASGLKYIGGTDWFQWGADRTVRGQERDGSWGGLSLPGENSKNIPNTAFALLFLSRGRAPVMMNKLQYDVLAADGKIIPGTWNQRPRDVANLTRMIGRQVEAQLNWQVVNLRQEQKDLHDAPMLYMAGGRAPHLTPEDQAHLKQFIEEGGMVIGNADCGSKAFADGFRKLGQAMFPTREFAPLPDDHPIYTAENFSRGNWKFKPVVESLGNGDRELMILIPEGDPARVWQSQAFPNIKSDVYGQLMIDILLYAEDQQGLREKGRTYMVARREDVQADKTIKVARLKYNGDWDPEPGGWRRLANVMHNDRKIDLNIQPVELGRGKLDSSFQAAELTVTPSMMLTEPGRVELQNFVNQGGTLVIDVAGGGGAGRTVAEREISRIFPETAAKPLPILRMIEPIFKDGALIREVTYRHFARMMLGNLHTARLRGLRRGDRIAVFYSPEDLTAGLVGQQVGGIVGYSPESATALMANILTYAGSH